MARVFIAVGSNLEPAANVRRALALLGGQVRIEGISTVYRTAPIGRPQQPPFYNCVVKAHTPMAPRELRAALRGIERALGRQRSADKYAPRTMDLDLLLYDDVATEVNGAPLPDPEIARRPFLLRGLLELDPDLALPDGRAVRDIAAAPGAGDMEPLADYTALVRREVAREQAQD